jgi:hypothetical protein
MTNVSKAIVRRRKCHPVPLRKKASLLRNFDRGVRWVVRPDGESYGSYSSSHDSLARSAGYEDEDQAYAKGALRVHYDPMTNTIRIEARKVTPQGIGLAKQIINKVPAGVAHVSIGEGDDFRSYMGEPTRVAADISRNRPSTISRWRSSLYGHSAEEIACQ